MYPSKELPRYECHKKVWALKIKDIIKDSDIAQKQNRETDGSALLAFEETDYMPIKVDYLYIRKHNPEIGGYYVVYEDGYISFSPAKAFESGYTKV